MIPFMSIASRIQEVQRNIATAAQEAGRDPAEITLVAATKTQSDAAIREAIAAGVSVCGENRVQEMSAHLETNAYEGAALHFIGHLQTNKVAKVVGRVDLIESVDSLRLLEAVNREAEKLAIVQAILLEVNIGLEETKSGIHPEQCLELALQAISMPHIRLRGLMAIPPAAGPESTRPFFRKMHQLFVDIGHKIEDNGIAIDCLSMGMSGDYMDAIREGATLVRIGTALFGPRPPLAATHT